MFDQTKAWSEHSGHEKGDDEVKGGRDVAALGGREAEREKMSIVLVIMPMDSGIPRVVHIVGHPRWYGTGQWERDRCSGHGSSV